MKNFKINTKIALVTGAASGLGFEFSKLLAKDNYNLILVDVNKKALVEVKNHIQNKYNAKVEVLTKNLGKADVSLEIFEFVNGRSIDVLINNAGFGLFGPFAQTNWQRESEMLSLHINTTTQLTKLAIKAMVKRGYGKILNVSSLAAFQPGPLMSIYYASKAYILSFSQAIANELKDTGVTVTVLCPGQTKTSFQKVVSNTSSKIKTVFNMACPLAVAKYGYEAMLKGKTVAIPGSLNRFLAFISRFVPRKMTTRIVRKIQEKNRTKQLIYNNL